MTGGPYLCTAVFCEKILTESDGVNSLVRIIDRFTISGEQPDMPASNIQLTICIFLKAGDFRGPAEVRIEPVSPSGHKYPELKFHVNFEGDNDRGIGLTVGLRTTFKEAGLYWFDVRLDEQLITRMPLRLVYQRNPVSGSADTQKSPGN